MSQIEPSTTYTSYINEKEELPRLSILTNYNQIMRIMTRNYMNPRFRRQQKLVKQGCNPPVDPVDLRWRQEVLDSQKMATILKSLNSPTMKPPRPRKPKLSEIRMTNKQDNRSIDVDEQVREVDEDNFDA